MASITNNSVIFTQHHQAIIDAIDGSVFPFPNVRNYIHEIIISDDDCTMDSYARIVDLKLLDSQQQAIDDFRSELYTRQMLVQKANSNSQPELDKDIANSLDKITDDIKRKKEFQYNLSGIPLLGVYVPSEKKVYLYIKTMQRVDLAHIDELIRIVYVHEMMHAYFDMCANMDGNHYIYEIEETMAELGTLAYCSLTSGYDYARAHVDGKKNDILAPYGFASYCFDQLYDTKNASADKILDFVKHYATIAKDICQTSYDVIRYTLELSFSYPSAPDGEKTVFLLLQNNVLHFGQKQDMRFADLYTSTKSQLHNLIWEKWNAKPGTPIDSAYQSQLDAIIESTMSENIMVESMAQWEPTTTIYKGGINYNVASGGLWKKSFLPFKHQMESWTHLLQPDTYKHSMVITTGTGSGKTESFMIPLVADLAEYIRNNGKTDGVQAIFLYPLNALMEDQKERLNEIIEASGEKIYFASYNGQSPNLPTDPSTALKEWNKSQGSRFSHELVFREEIRGKSWNPTTSKCDKDGRVPNIILTNPTMLEYILLRQADKDLIQSGSLKWMVIDETHSYTGAGADELAMQIRRVLKAFDVTPNDVHFATSSATVGSDVSKLKDFISGITGQKNIDVISGKRSIPSCSLAPQNYPVFAQLTSKNYVYLRDLFPSIPTTEERLKELDRLAEGGLRVKVHLFDKALTNGLFINVENLCTSPLFTLTDEIPLDTTVFRPDPRYLYACHCKNCGAVLANGHIANGAYSRKKQDYYILPSISPAPTFSDTEPLSIQTGGRCVMGAQTGVNAYYAFQKCPCCGAPANRIKSFSISAMATNQGLLPTLLDQTTMRSGDKGIKPYDGHQLISFADSRRGAARPSLQQNLDTEEIWVIQTLREAIANVKSLSISKVQSQITAAATAGDTKAVSELAIIMAALQNNDTTSAEGLAASCNWWRSMPSYLTWRQALDALLDSPTHKLLAACFAKEKEINRELDDDETLGDNLDDTYRQRYVLNALYRVMHKRDKERFSAEGYGLLKVVYPLLDNVTAIPTSVINLNTELSVLGKPTIDLTNWKNLLKIYLDYDVRVDECLFYRDRTNSPMWGTIDISICRDLSSTYSVRRSVKDMDRHSSNWRIYELLMQLFGCSNKSELDAMNPMYFSMLEKVAQDIWNELADPTSVPSAGTTRTTPNTTHLLSYGETCDDKGKWEADYLSPADKADGRTGYRLNLDNLAFTIVDDMWEDGLTNTLHDTTFCEMSPYEDHKICSPVNLLTSTPVFVNCEKRDKVLNKNKHFIQVEHTAQVNKKRANERIEQFKQHNINVLACSTTMEMGVDIGELEIVAMANVPPHPANYKQRVGRAGRAMQSKSASIMTCNSDAVGLPVLKNPEEQLLEREVQTPVTRLHSPQIIQRHVNSYLLREFFKTHYNNTAKIKTWKLVDFFFDNAKVDYVHGTSHLMVGPTICLPVDYPTHRTMPVMYAANTPYTTFLDWLKNRQIRGDYNTLLGELTQSTCYDLTINPTAPSFNTIIQETIDSISTLYNNWHRELLAVCQKAIGFSSWSTPLRRRSPEMRINFDFVSLLTPTIETYFGENQFIPNANMPVGVVAAKINRDDSFDNPSRPLPIALAEYAPGQQRVMDGKSFRMAGVEWDSSVPYPVLDICTSCGHTMRNSINAGKPCPICGKPVIQRKLIVPTAFLTESDTSRSMDEGTFTRVNTCLLNAPTWPSPTTPNNLFQVMSGATAPNASILTYIAGEDPLKGYCVCVHKNNNGQICGRCEAETSTDNYSTPTSNIQLYHDLMGDNHRNLQDGTIDSFVPVELESHMLIGGDFRTDFSLLFAKKSPTINDSVNNEILTTLGIMACDELSLLLPCERQDIGFFIAGDDSGRKSLCIYDIAKGGAGYSSQLDEVLWYQLLDKCRNRLDNFVNSPNPELNEILSRSTMRFMEEIDILGTYNWLCQEFNNRTSSSRVQNAYPGAYLVSRSTMDTDISKIGVTKMLFVQSNVNMWNYDIQNLTTPCWKDINHYSVPGTKMPVVFSCDLGLVPVEIVSTFAKMRDWADFYVDNETQHNGVYPLACVGHTLYLTDDAQFAQLNGNWAMGNIYAVTLVNAPVPTPYTPLVPRSQMLWIPASQQIMSDKLYDLVEQLDNEHTMSTFLSHTRGHRLQFKYIDEHVKTQLGMYMAIQFIKRMVDISNCASYEVIFQNEEYADQYGKTEDDPSRRLWDVLSDNSERDILLDNLLYNLTTNSSIISLKRGRSPHWRCLEVKDLDTNQSLKVLPHGGFATDWSFDSVMARQIGIHYGCNDTDINTSIPVCSKDYTILYMICVD